LGRVIKIFEINISQINYRDTKIFFITLDILITSARFISGYNGRQKIPFDFISELLKSLC
tara:strand:+ start:1149 stop:1328 length:180 start_codon:yes stop_codon:yes gene_type:complete